MAANFQRPAPTNKEAILANRENRIPNREVVDKEKIKGIRVQGLARLQTSSSFSRPTVAKDIQQRVAGRNTLQPIVRSQAVRSLEAAKAAESSVRPEDWVIVPAPRPIDIANIDSDLESHLMCPSLAPAQYSYMMSIEHKFMTGPGFLQRTKIDMQQRIIILNWMATVHRQLGEQQESLFLAINYFDRFMASNPNGPTIFSNTNHTLSPTAVAQRVAATALYLSFKFEEIYAPTIDQVASCTDHPRTTPVEIRRIEFEMLRTLKFRVNPPLLNHFLRRCSKAAGATAMLHSLGKYLIEIALYDPDLATGTKTSLVAAACSYIAIRVFGERTRSWDPMMLHYSGGYTESEVRPVAAKLVSIHKTLATREGSMVVKSKWEDMARNSHFVEWVRNTQL